MIYTLAVFFPWLAFFLRGRIFSAIFSFILWVVLCLPIIVAIAATFIPDLREYLGFLLALWIRGADCLVFQFIFIVGSIDTLVLFGHTWGSNTKGNGTTY
ncbi:flagellar biosynthesis protein FlgG [Helicobacter pylori]|uniref:flagellar biosynthesis protein FlgG n=1 Tax=Helicobacter pylori TaxID=210 RepID=UPI000FDF0407|nr:flagellar biosynthesis protein FlgG [Helicobacter pylori]RVZ29697.1 flagellar biosynthesis protein FlgG [Helicobacter pylori]